MKYEQDSAKKVDDQAATVVMARVSVAFTGSCCTGSAGAQA